MQYSLDTLAGAGEPESLPFVGRQGEIDQIFNFWRSSLDTDYLRALLLIGEAGAGKSRLMESIVPRITGDGGTIVHLKLYHDATAAIAPLVIESLRASSLFNGSFRSAAIDLPTAAAALRRVARLRPTFLVIEDIQLLEGKALHELGQLLEMIADEPIAALFATRPVKQGARGVIERYLVGEIVLEGLSTSEIAELWRAAFGDEGDRGGAENIRQATLGNPLAIRSVFRAVSRSGGEEKGVRIGGALLSQVLHHRVGLLAEGMVAHLDDEELQGATRLAWLGEIFARESARLMIDDADLMIDLLQRRGILSPMETPALSLNMIDSDLPLLTFTHSLLHRHLVRQSRPSVDLLARLISSTIPLYSILPFQLIAGAEKLPCVGIDIMRGGVVRGSELIQGLCNGTDGRWCHLVWEASDRLYRACRAALSESDAHDIEIALQNARLCSYAREKWSEEYEHDVREFLRLTEDPSTEEQGWWRLYALVHFQSMVNKRNESAAEYVWKEGGEVLRRFPRLITAYNHFYIEFLEFLASSCYSVFDFSLIDRLEERLASLTGPDIDDDVRAIARRKLSPLFLRIFSTPEELRQRLDLIAELEPRATPEDWLFLREKSRLLESIGRIDEFVTDLQGWRLRLINHGLRRQAKWCRLDLIRGNAHLGLSRETVEKELDEILSAESDSMASSTLFGNARDLVIAAMLRGESDWARDLIARFPPCRPMLPVPVRVILALDEESDELRKLFDELDARFAADDDRRRGTRHENAIYAFDPALLALIGSLIAEASIPPDQEMLRAMGKRVIDAPILRLADILKLSAAILLLRALERRDPTLTIVDPLTADIREALLRALSWLAERRLPLPIEMLLDRHGEILTPRQRSTWKDRATAFAAERALLSAGAGDAFKIRVSMIGSIEIRKQDGSIHKLRGERMRVLLALLIANVFLPKPLSHELFAAIASGIDHDPDAARHSLTHMIYRLREIIGFHALDTSADIPRLNLSIVSADLIDAAAALRSAHAALHDGLLVKAARSLWQVLEICHGEILFPTLYHSFFEALRTDFEQQIHALLLAISRRLMEEEDLEGAERLLQRGFTAMPEDEEIAEQLCAALRMLGRNAEAARVHSLAERSGRGV